MKKSRIVMADEHNIVLEGIRTVLSPDYDVVGEVADGRSLIELVDREKPDLAVVDISMPGLNGIDAVRQIKTRHPDIAIVFLTMHYDATYARRAFAAGGDGYVLKHSAGRELRSAVQQVLAGHAYLSPALAEKMPDTQVSELRRVTEPRDLTDRQREVLQLIAEGKLSKEIAGILNISIKTVEFHRQKIMDQLGLRSIAELTRYAVKHGIVHL